MDESLLTIVIPAYNEAENLPRVLPDLFSFCKQKNYQLIIVNDGSKDKTKEILDQQEDIEFLNVIHHKVNRGYGGALKSGIAAARTKYVITFDADGQHSFEDVDKLLKMITDMDADMIVGSRKGAKGENKIRAFGKWIIRKIVKLLIPIKIYDINSGMKIYLTELAQKYIKICPNAMAFSDVITLIFISQRHLVLETPITIKERVAGESTINFKTAFETVLEILNIVILFNPIRIFLPLSILFTVIGLAWGIPLMLMDRGLSVGASLLIMAGVIFFVLGLLAEQLSHIRKSTINQ